MKISGNIIDIHNRIIYPGSIITENKQIARIEREDREYRQYIMPGLIDAHIHIESSMATPGSFAGTAVRHGTTGVVSDPHEIANVLGINGIEFMLEDSQRVPLKFWFGAPSCVPATDFETNGAVLNSTDINKLLERKEIKYLAEVMNFPGVVNNDPEVLRKLNAAKKNGKKIDGHAPGLTGDALKKYIEAGISTDHECVSINEAKEKLALGMKILIREGSAARNLDELKDLIRSDADMVMLCSDDLHPGELVKGHINTMVSKLLMEGFDMFDVIRSCTLNPQRHYGLEAGLLREGDPADFIIAEDFRTMKIIETWIDGKRAYGNGKVFFDYNPASYKNRFDSEYLIPDDLKVIRTGRTMRVIRAFDGEIYTAETFADAGTEEFVKPDIGKDLLKIVVKDRYIGNPPAIAFINGFGMKKGALASSIAHDSHNIVCVGTSDYDITEAVNRVIEMKGGLAVSDGSRIYSMDLPVAGLMSSKPVPEIAGKYKELSDAVKSMGCTLKAPFMTLSFLALLVIPELKLSDKGLFDGKSFRFVSLFTD